MVKFGSPSVREATVESIDIPDAELPLDNEELFNKLKQDPLLDTPDMNIAGDWTHGAIADRIAMEERVYNNRINWDAFKTTDWKSFQAEADSDISIQSGPRTLIHEAPESVSINDLDSGEEVNAIIALGEPTTGPASGFAAGDPGIGTPSTKTYRMDGRSGAGTAVTRNGNTVMSGTEATRSIAFNPPGGGNFLQMIVKEDLGYQARALLEALTDIAGLGTDATIKAPSFGTTGPDISLMTPFSFSYNRALGVSLLQPTFDLVAGNGGEAKIQLRDNNGEELASTSVNVQLGGNRIVVGFLNAPSSGYVTLDLGGLAYTVENTEVFPPI